MTIYLKLLKDLLQNGSTKQDRTSTGTKSIFGYQLRFPLQEGFPLLTTKKLHFKSIVYELLWLLKGDVNVAFLNEHGVTIWDEWADENGDLGPVYGQQWRKWEGYEKNQYFDQITEAINLIKTDPDSRRIIVSAWNVGQLRKMALLPCHVLFQFYVNKGELSCHLYQRSSDVFLGLPFNIASYALLTHMVAQVTGITAKDLIISIGDAHLYSNHFEQAKLQLSRKPGPLPTLHLHPGVKELGDFKYEDIKLIDYNAAPHIKASVAV